MRAGEIDLDAWQAEIEQIFEQEITIHFAAEEKEVFPAAARFTELSGLVLELLEEHSSLRNLFERARLRTLDANELSGFAETLARHIRKEERELFEGMQRVLDAKTLAAMGAALELALQNAAQSCILPNDETRLRPR